MEKKHFFFFNNFIYWVALILSLMTLVPTDLKLIMLYGLAAVLCSTIFFSMVKIGPKYISKYVKENAKQSILIALFCILHSAVFSKSFYLLWIPSNKVAALASRFYLTSSQLLWLIIVAVFPSMVCSLFVFSSFLLSKYHRNSSRFSTLCLGLFLALMAFQSAQGIACGLVGGMELKHVFSGTLIVFALIVLVYALSANEKISVLLGSFPFILFSTINYYVYCFRGRELCPYDLLSLGTAMNVVSEYKIFFSLFLLFGWLAWVFLMTAFFLTKREAGYSKKVARLCSAALCIVSILLVFVLEKDTTVKSWTLAGSASNGTALNFFLQLRDSQIEAPENYSEESIKQLEKRYSPNQNTQEDPLPSIIVIMDESFTDFSVLGNDVQTTEPLLPFTSAMEDNTVQGYVYSSVYGGNTANSEFEFLTGNSMAFLPHGSVPYQQYIFEEQYSLISYLHSIGYDCIATHPFFAGGWNRPTVYKNFGFDEMTFISDYPETDLVRKYLSDQDMFEYVIEKYEDRDQSAGFFLFGITIQNHGGYTYNGFESSVPLQYSKHYPEAEQYLTLANLSDHAAEYLINYFSAISDPVVICYFGDHQPRVESKFLEEIHGGGFDDLESQMLKYKVPFFIWANYDIEEQSDIETSINYLSTFLLDVCGFEFPAYNQFLHEAEQRIPVLTGNGYYSVSKHCFLPVQEAVGEEKEMLNQYQILQYNNLFDKNQLSPIFEPE